MTELGVNVWIFAGLVLKNSLDSKDSLKKVRYTEFWGFMGTFFVCFGETDPVQYTIHGIELTAAMSMFHVGIQSESMVGTRGICKGADKNFLVGRVGRP